MRIGKKIMESLKTFLQALFDVWNSASGQGR